MNQSINNLGLLILQGHGKLIEFGTVPNPNTIIVDKINDLDGLYNSIKLVEFDQDICMKQASDFKMGHIPNYINGNVVVMSNDNDKNSVFASIGTQCLETVDLLSNMIGINGSLYIIGTDYHFINGLEKLEYVMGDIVIINNPNLKQIFTFPSLVNAGRIIIANNPHLERIVGFEKTRILAGLYLINNLVLSDVYGFTHLKSIIDLVVSANPKLKNITGFGYLERAQNHFNISHNNNENQSIMIIDAFHSLESVGNFFIKNNHYLRELHFPKLIKIDQSLVFVANQDISSLKLDSLIFSGSIIIKYNDQLTEISFDKLIEISGALVISNNMSLQKISTFGFLKKIDDGVLVTENNSLKIIKGFDVLGSIGKSNKPIISEKDSVVVNFSGQNPIEKSLEVLTENPIEKSLEVLTENPIEKSLEVLTKNPIEKSLEVLTENPIEKSLKVLTENYHLEFETGELVAVPTEFSNNTSILVCQNPELLKINTFHSLRVINGNIYLVDNSDLRSVCAFEELEYLFDIYVKDNLFLEQFYGFNQLEGARDIIISSPKLIDLISFEKLQTCQHLYLGSNNRNIIRTINEKRKCVSGLLVYLK